MNAWVLRGQIIKGHQRGGSMLGFPTANMQLDEKCVAQLRALINTVWCGFAMIEDENVPGENLPGLPVARTVAVPNIPGNGTSSWTFVSDSSDLNQQQKQHQPSKNFHFVYPTVLSIGNNPHFKASEITVEPYIMHKFEHDFYGRRLRLVAVEKIRDMGAFTSIEALIQQIKDDCAVGAAMLRKPQALLLRQALVDQKVWKSSPAPATDSSAPADVTTAENSNSVVELPGANSAASVCQMLGSTVQGDVSGSKV